METLQSLDRVLTEWIRRIVGEVQVDPGLPGSETATRTVHSYLLGIEGPTEPNDARRDVRNFILRYIVMASDRDVGLAHDRMANLLLAALDHPTFDATAVRADAAIWLALRLAPRPAIKLGVPWQVQRDVRLAPAVRHELRLDFVGLRLLEGVIIGPNGIGIANARIRVFGARRTTNTDLSGHFRIDGIVDTAGPLSLEIAARGHLTRVDVRPNPDGTPLRIHIDPSLR